MRNTRSLYILPTSFFVLLSQTSLADTDGYFTTGWGVRAKGMAGISIAFAHDALAAANNPAAIVRLGRRFDTSLSFFSPSRHYSVSGAPTGSGSFLQGSVKSDKELFLIPDMGYISPQKDNSALSFAVYANGGMNTTWPASANGGAGVYGNGKAGVNLEQMFFNASYARSIDRQNALGISAILAYQTFSADGLQTFNPTSTTLSGNGVDKSTGLGLRLGWQSDLGHGLRCGAVYQPKISMSRFDKYAGLFADGGKFDIPGSYGFGISQEQGKGVLGAEFKTIQYSKVRAVGNSMAKIVNGLGSEDGPGFGWRDMTVYKLGYEWQAKKDLLWRVGMSYGRQPIPSSEMLFNILAPGVVEWHFSTGFTKKVNEHSEWSGAFTFSPEKKISGPNPNDTTQTIELRMRELELTIGYTYKF